MEDVPASRAPLSTMSGRFVSTNVTVASAALGAFATVSFSLSVWNLMVTANVTTANMVTVSFFNQRRWQWILVVGLYVFAQQKL